MLRTGLIYGLALAGGAVGLQWLQYQAVARAHLGEVYLGLVALAFLGLGVWLGGRLFHRPAETGGFRPNPQALAALEITPLGDCQRRDFGLAWAGLKPPGETCFVPSSSAAPWPAWWSPRRCSPPCSPAG